MIDIGINKKHLNAIKDILHLYTGSENALKVWVFGSRARGDYRPYSDIDLLIDGCIDVDVVSEVFEESDLPYKVDLVRMSELAPEYAESVNRDKKLLFQFNCN